jgi:methyl-accepting chemotaxis protein
MAIMNNVKIKTKMLFSFGLVALIAGILGCCGYITMAKMNAENDETFEKIVIPLEHIAKISISFQRTRINIRDACTATSHEEREKFIETLRELRNEIDNSALTFEKTLISQEGHNLFEEFRESNKVYVAMGDQILAFLNNNEKDKALSLMQGDAKSAAFHEQETINKLMDNKTEQAKILDHENEADSSRGRMVMLIGSISAVVIAIVLGIVQTLAITTPLSQAISIAKELSTGNFTVKMQVDRQDEIGQLFGEVEIMVKNLRTMFLDVADGIKKLTLSSTDLAAVAKQLSSSAQDTANKSTTVASSVEETSSNIQSVSAAMEQSSSNVNMVATSTEEMTATVKEIGQNAEKARTISENAVLQSHKTSDKMMGLGESAKRIGKVTEAITEISEQTNLLALNATIEAARAGDAGKGFAVVANEIKELAKQTAASTVEIKNQIEEIQGKTNSTIEDIGNISEVITEINSVINGIASAVEEQSTATQEIAGNISQAAQGIGEVNESMSQTATVVTDIARNISEINDATTQVGSGSIQVQKSAGDLSELALQLEKMIGKFKV